MAAKTPSTRNSSKRAEKALRAGGWKRPKALTISNLIVNHTRRGKRYAGILMHEDGGWRIGVETIDRTWINITVSPHGTTSVFESDTIEAWAEREMAEGTL